MKQAETGDHNTTSIYNQYKTQTSAIKCTRQAEVEKALKQYESSTKLIEQLNVTAQRELSREKQIYVSSVYYKYARIVFNNGQCPNCRFDAYYPKRVCSKINDDQIICANERNHIKALELYRKSVERSPDNVESLKDIVYFYLQHDDIRYTEGIQICDKLLAMQDVGFMEHGSIQQLRDKIQARVGWGDKLWADSKPLGQNLSDAWEITKEDCIIL